MESLTLLPPPPPSPLPFTSEILKNLAAEGSSDSESDAVEGRWAKSSKKLLNLKLRHVGITDKATA